jgi:tRNA A37 threonylcarbamoyladenosine dehydratase
MLLRVQSQILPIGAPKLQLVDFDHVERTNITSQGHLTNDVGRPKVQATGEHSLSGGGIA